MEKRKDAFNINNDPRYRELANALAATDLEIKRLQDESVKIGPRWGSTGAGSRGPPCGSSRCRRSSRVRQHQEALRDALEKERRAQQAENLERRQKGEQFRVVDLRGCRKSLSNRTSRWCFSSVLWGVWPAVRGIFAASSSTAPPRPRGRRGHVGFKVLANIPRIVSKAS